MAQTNDLALKRKLLISGDELAGFIESSPLVDEEGTVEVPGFGRKIDIGDGVRKLAPIDIMYKVQRDTNTRETLLNWYQNKELHDVTIVDYDAAGVEICRTLLRDCENVKFDEKEFNAGSVSYKAIGGKIVCTTEPVFLT